MPMSPYFLLFPPGTSVETRKLLVRGAKGLPDGQYRFVELYCDEPGCDCRRVVVQVWDEDDRPLATFNYGWESPEYYAKWSKYGDLTMAKEMASLTREPFGPQSQYTGALMAQFKKALSDPGYVAKLKQHYAEFRAVVEAASGASGAARPRRRRLEPRTKKRRGAPTGLIYQLKITLRGIQPPIWRRVQLPGDTVLADLHLVIQAAMGWTMSHLYCFRVGGVSFSTPMRGTDFEDSGDESDAEVQLDEVCGQVKSKLIYEYDFGDGWEHDVVVEKIMKPEPKARYPHCVDGKRACPPEDCGGAGGYADFLEAMADPTHEMHEEMKEWVGGEWDPEAFDLELVNAVWGS
jgi:Plasmid pRiA4b ORF-3-like protein